MDKLKQEQDRIARLQAENHAALKAAQEGILSGGCDRTSIVQAFAAHREAAAKAERDRLLNWAANNFLAEGNYTGALVVHKLARALEQNP